MTNPLDTDPGRLDPAAQPVSVTQVNSAAGPLVLPHDPTEPPLNDYDEIRRDSFDAAVPIYNQNRCYTKEPKQ